MHTLCRRERNRKKNSYLECIQIAGTVLTAVGVVFFLVAVVTMRNNWRAGFDKKQGTSLVSSGFIESAATPLLSALICSILAVLFAFRI